MKRLMPALLSAVCLVGTACPTPQTEPPGDRPIDVVPVDNPVTQILVDDDDFATAALPGPQTKHNPIGGDHVLSIMGFDAADDEAEPVVGDVVATFTSPLIAVDESAPSVLGTADLTIAGVTRAVSALSYSGVYDDTDLVYAALFDEVEPWHYVVIAAHEADLVAGATLTLDGTQAAAVVVDEVLGTGRVTTGGELSVTVADGANLAGSLTGDTVEVTLENWPQGLFPLTSDGEELETEAASGSGTFSAAYDDGTWTNWGTASVEATAGALALSAAVSNVMVWDGQAQINLGALSTGNTFLTLLVPADQLVAGAAIELSGFESAAYLSDVYGEFYAYSGGTLTVESADLSLGGTVTGSVVLSDTAYHVRTPCDGPGCEEPIDPEQCVGLNDIPDTFAPTEAYTYVAEEVGELPEGFDRLFVLYDTNGSDHYFYALVPEDATVAPGLTLDLTPADMGDGHYMPQAVYGAGACDEVVFVEGGTLVLDAGPVSGVLTGTLTTDVGGETFTHTFSVVEG